MSLGKSDLTNWANRQAVSVRVLAVVLVCPSSTYRMDTQKVNLAILNINNNATERKRR